MNNGIFSELKILDYSEAATYYQEEEPADERG